MYREKGKVKIVEKENGKIIEKLYKNRLLNTKEEFEEFEQSLKELSEVIQEEDILDLCKVFDDNTEDDEVMFGLIHLIEMFSSERAFELIVMGVANMTRSAPNWAKIIIYRCLNDDFSRNMLKKAISLVKTQERQTIISMLNIIKMDDSHKFETAVNEVLY